MVAIFGLMRTELTPASFRALRAWEPAHRESAATRVISYRGVQHTGVVKLSCLANCETSASNDQNLLHIDEVACPSDSTAVQVRLSIGCFLGLVRCGSSTMRSKRREGSASWRSSLDLQSRSQLPLREPIAGEAPGGVGPQDFCDWQSTRTASDRSHCCFASCGKSYRGTMNLSLSRKPSRVTVSLR